MVKKLWLMKAPLPARRARANLVGSRPYCFMYSKTFFSGKTWHVPASSSVIEFFFWLILFISKMREVFVTRAARARDSQSLTSLLFQIFKNCFYIWKLYICPLLTQLSNYLLDSYFWCSIQMKKKFHGKFKKAKNGKIAITPLLFVRLSSDLEGRSVFWIQIWWYIKNINKGHQRSPKVKKVIFSKLSYYFTNCHFFYFFFLLFYKTKMTTCKKIEKNLNKKDIKINQSSPK